jgi:anti-sigma B factor antagonist
MELHIRQQEHITIVTVSGSLDALTAEQLSAALDEQLTANHTHFILDFSDVKFCASAGIRVVMKLYKITLAQDGKICLAGLQEGVLRTFEMSGLLDNVLTHYPDVELAFSHWA